MIGVQNNVALRRSETVIDAVGSPYAPKDVEALSIWLTDATATRFLDAIIDTIPAAIIVKDASDLRFLLVNKAAENLMRCRRDDMIGRTNCDLLPHEEAAAFDAIDREVLQSGDMHVGEGTFLTPDRVERLMHTCTVAVQENGKPRYLICISDDITERRANEMRIVHLAHHDPLTDLPNRVLLSERLTNAIAIQHRQGGAIGVLFIDLDHFKGVNDSLGHSAGDALLVQVAQRLRGCLHADDLVSRQGGDEFIVIQPRLGSPEEARRLAERIIAALMEPFVIKDQEVVIGASVGIAVAPQDGMSADMLLRHADMALYRAKADGRGTTRFFEEAMEAGCQARRRLEHDLRIAFAMGELVVHYQPLLRAADDRIIGFEALLRWQHPERGFVSPAEFIPVAEEIGLIGPITQWVLKKACAEATHWAPDVRIAVNLSPAHFRKQNPAFAVVNALAESGLPPNRLEVEITESVLLTDSEANVAILHQIRALGVRIAMDDFGTGYSSLSYLRSFPFDKIKIDRSFISDLGENAHSTAIVRAVIGLCASLGMTTTAEGVETIAQLERLRAEGCDEFQGFLFGRAVPAEEARLLLTRQFRIQRMA